MKEIQGVDKESDELKEKHVCGCCGARFFRKRSQPCTTNWCICWIAWPTALTPLLTYTKICPLTSLLVAS